MILAGCKSVCQDIIVVKSDSSRHIPDPSPKKRKTVLKIALVALENTLRSTLTGPLDIFGVSSHRWQQLRGEPSPFCKAEIITPGNTRVTDAHGIPLVPTTATIEARYDIVLLPATYGDLTTNLENSFLIEWLRDQHQQGCCICSVCAGSFLVAAAGLLDGRKATTHWALATDFRNRFPKVDLSVERILIDLGDIITAGGVTSYLDLCIHMLQRFGSQELAVDIARIFLIDTIRRDQLPYAVSSYPKQHGDQQILVCQQWLESQYTEPFTVSRLATVAGLEERTFTRRFKHATGMTPGSYIQSLRIDAARHLLEKTAEPLDQVTRLVGYEDYSSFRRLFMKHTGMSPSAYRKRFSLISR